MVASIRALDPNQISRQVDLEKFKASPSQKILGVRAFLYCFLYSFDDSLVNWENWDKSFWNCNQISLHKQPQPPGSSELIPSHTNSLVAHNTHTYNTKR